MKDRFCLIVLMMCRRDKSKIVLCRDFPQRFVSDATSGFFQRFTSLRCCSLHFDRADDCGNALLPAFSNHETTIGIGFVSAKSVIDVSHDHVICFFLPEFPGCVHQRNTVRTTGNGHNESIFDAEARSLIPSIDLFGKRVQSTLLAKSRMVWAESNSACGSNPSSG